MGKTKTKSRSVGDSPKPPITIRSTNVKILDDNIAKLEKAIQAGDVSANPSGTAEDTLLSTIGIDGKKYELGPSAENTSYNNTDSGLTADDVQAAIDEISSDLKDATTWESITVPEPTISEDGKTRTYTVDLSAYKYIRVTVGPSSTGGSFETDFLAVGDTIRKYYQVSSQVESYAIVSSTSSLLVYTETLSTHNVDIKFILGVK